VLRGVSERNASRSSQVDVHVCGDPQPVRCHLRHSLQADFVGCTGDDVGFAIGVAKRLVPDARQLGGDCVGVGKPAVCSSRYEPFRVFGPADGHVLPETPAVVPLACGWGIAKVGTEVDLHAQEVFSGTPRA
jgi:hypothetical protein